MPTYDYRCERCGAEIELFRSISDYLHNPRPLFCCGREMGRRFTVIPGLAVHNALASERHYDGLRAIDGTDISSRKKHRDYMKARGLTTMDDYHDTWKKDAADRAERIAGNDPQRRKDLERAIAKLDR